MTPVWLLDVDGVLNATRPSWGATPMRRYARAKGREWKLTWAPALIRRIWEIHRAGTVEITWATTWCSDADEVERAMVLPTFPRAWTEELCSHAAGVAKLHAARAVLAAGRRLIWTDDEVVPCSGPLHDELTRGGRALLIAPSPKRGLQPGHLDAIEAFLTEGTE